MSEIVLLTSWRALFGSELTIDTLRTALRPYKLSAILLALARISACLKTWQNKVDFALDDELTARFLPGYVSAIRRLKRDGNRYITFSRIGVLFVAKQACLACDVTGREVSSNLQAEEVLSTFLMANDLMLPGPFEVALTPFEVAAQIFPFADCTPLDTYAAEIARNILLFEEIVPLLQSRPDYIALESKFLSAVDASPRQFAQFAFGASTKFITEVEKQYESLEGSFVLTPHYLKRFITPERGDALFRKLSATDTQIRKDPDILNRKPNDFLAFQRRPLIEFTTDNYLCIDPGFLLDKAGRSLYWTLHETEADSKVRHQLLTFWSVVIERYVGWLFENSYAGANLWRFSPRFSNNDEAFDAYLLEGENLIVFEVKASVLTVQSKYSFSGEVLSKEVMKKAITGDSRDRKGVAQLHGSLKRFLDGGQIEGLSLKGIKKIYPVIVFLDHGFLSPGLPPLYDQHFNRSSLRTLFQGTLTPMFSMTVADLEIVLPFTNETGLSDLLEHYGRKDRQMRGTFGDAALPILARKQPQNTHLLDRFRSIVKEIKNQLSPVD